MKLTKPMAVAMAKAFAVYCIGCDRQSGFRQRGRGYDCVAAEETDMYAAFIREFWPSAEPWETNDPMYTLFRETLYAEAQRMNEAAA